MNSLLRKELREHYLHFVVMAFFPLVILGGMALMRAFDPSSAALVLFVLTGPALSFLVGSHLFAAELKNQTLSFLVGLPLSRTRIWVTKIVFGVCFCAALYAWFLLVMVSISGSPQVSGEFVGVIVLVSAAAFSLGAMAGMLPEQFTGLMLAAIGLVGALLTQFNRFLVTMNWPLFSVLLVPVPLAASYMAFRRGELMDCWRRWVWTFGTLGVGLAVVLTIISGLDAAADARRFTLAELDPTGSATVERWEGIGPVEGGGVLAMAHVAPPWWDPIQRNVVRGSALNVAFSDIFATHQVRPFVLYPDTGVVKPVGPRMAAAQPMPDGRHVLLNVVHRSLGILFDHVVSLQCVDLRGEQPTVEIDTNAVVLGCTPAGAVVYQRYVRDPLSGTEIVELCVRDLQEAKSKVLAVAESARKPYGVLLSSGGAVLWISEKGRRVEAIRRADQTVHLLRPSYQYQMVPLRGGGPVALPFSGRLDNWCLVGDAVLLAVETDRDALIIAPRAASGAEALAPEAAALAATKRIVHAVVDGTGEIAWQPWLDTGSGLPGRPLGLADRRGLIGYRLVPTPRDAAGALPASYTRATSGRILEDWEQPRDYVITMYDVANRACQDLVTVPHTRDVTFVRSATGRTVLVSPRDSIDPVGRSWVLKVAGTGVASAPPTVVPLTTPVVFDLRAHVIALADERFLVMKPGETWLLDAATGACRRLGQTGGDAR